MADSSLNRGAFTLSWPATTDPNGQAVTYALDRRPDPGTSWARVASGIKGTSYAFAADQYAQYPEAQGCWRYRVVASDGWAEAGPSTESERVLVARGAGSCPAPSTTPAPEPAPDPLPDQGGESAPPGPGAPVAAAAAAFPGVLAPVPVALTLKVPAAIARTTLRRTGLRVTVACSTPCRATLRLARGTRTLARRTVTVGRTSKPVRLRARSGAGTITLRVTAPEVTTRTKRVRVR